MTLVRVGGRESSKKVRIWPKNDQCATLDFINSLLSVIIPYQHISKSSWGPWTRCKTFWRRRISCSTRSPSESWRLSFFFACWGQKFAWIHQWGSPLLFKKSAKSYVSFNKKLFSRRMTMSLPPIDSSDREQHVINLFYGRRMRGAFGKWQRS